MNDTASRLKGRITATLDELPEEALAEVLAFVERLAADYTQQPTQSPRFKPTPMGGLSKGANISEEDIAELRREMWEEVDRKWQNFS